MIAHLLIFVAAVSQVSRAAAQTPASDSLASVIAATRARSSGAARVFLDSTRTAADRERAASDIGAFLDTADALAALQVAWNPRESERIRVIALSKGGYLIDNHPDAETRVLAAIADRQSPPGFRSAAMNQLMALLVGSRMRDRRMSEIVKVLQEVSTDSDSLLRRGALAWLATTGDPGTIDRLIRALDPQSPFHRRPQKGMRAPTGELPFVRSCSVAKTWQREPR